MAREILSQVPSKPYCRGTKCGNMVFISGQLGLDRDDKVVPGGIIAFDEYMGTWEHESFPGARQAIDEFLTGRGLNPETIERDQGFGKYYFVKPQ